MSMLLRRRYATDNDTQGAVKAKAAPVLPAEEKAEKKVSENKADVLEYTEEDIKKMAGAKLRKLAKENGVQNPEDLTAGELKDVLVELLIKQ